MIATIMFLGDVECAHHSLARNHDISLGHWISKMPFTAMHPVLCTFSPEQSMRRTPVLTGRTLKLFTNQAQDGPIINMHDLCRRCGHVGQYPLQMPSLLGRVLRTKRAR